MMALKAKGKVLGMRFMPKPQQSYHRLRVGIMRLMVEGRYEPIHSCVLIDHFL